MSGSLANTKQPRDRSQFNRPQMLPPKGSIGMGVDYRNHRFAPGLFPGWLGARVAGGSWYPVMMSGSLATTKSRHAFRFRESLRRSSTAPIPTTCDMILAGELTFTLFTTSFSTCWPEIKRWVGEVPCDDVRIAGNHKVAPRLEHRLLLLEAVYLYDATRLRECVYRTRYGFMSVFIGLDDISWVYLPDAMRLRVSVLHVLRLRGCVYCTKSRHA